MDAVIKQIIGIESRAQEMVTQASERCRQIAKQAEESCLKIEEDIRLRQEERFLKVTENERASQEAQIAQIRKENEARLSSLKKMYAEKKEAWTDEIYQNIIGLKAVAGERGE